MIWTLGIVPLFLFSKKKKGGLQYEATRLPTAREELKTQERTKEIDQFMESLFALPEMASLEAMRKMCRVYAAPTSERTEFNLFCDTDHFHVWLRLITRERDYNLYVHFYVDENKR